MSEKIRIRKIDDSLQDYRMLKLIFDLYRSERISVVHQVGAELQASELPNVVESLAELDVDAITQDLLITDISQVEGMPNEYDIHILDKEGARAMVIARLGTISAIAIVEDEN